jgi:hypothetical protein
MYGIPVDQVEEERSYDLLDGWGEGTVRESDDEAYSPHRSREIGLEAARVHQRPAEVWLVILCI